MSELKNLTNLLFKQNFERTSDNDLMPNENIKIDHLIKAAVLIPIPGTPGMLSDVSPISAK